MFLAGCSSRGVKLSADDIFTIPVSAFPNGWRMGTAYQESEFGTQNTFFVQYSSETFQHAIYWFVHYESEEAASDAFHRYRGATFYSEIGREIEWEEITKFADFDLLIADEYETGCAMTTRNEEAQQQCSAQMRYRNCNLRISANIDDIYMSVQEFTEILEYVDNHIDDTEVCRGTN